MKDSIHFRWFKMAVDFFDDHKIKRLRKLPGGAEIVLCWVAVLCMAMRSTKKGYLLIDANTMASAEDLAIFADVSVETAGMAIQAFKRLGMVTEEDDGLLLVTNFSKHQELDRIAFVTEQARRRKQLQRQRQKQALLELKRHAGVTRDNVGTDAIKNEIETENKRENEKEKDEDVQTPESGGLPARVPPKRQHHPSAIESAYLAAYEQSLGVKPAQWTKADVIMLNRLQAAHGDLAGRALAAFFRDDYARQSAFSVGLFTKQFNRYAHAPKPSGGMKTDAEYEAEGNRIWEKIHGKK